MRTCTKCLQEKPLSEFLTFERDGQMTRCRDCLNAKTRAYHQANRERLNALRQVRYESDRERENKRKREWQRANPEKRRIYQKRYMAKDTDRYQANVANANHRRRAGGGGVTAWQWRGIRAEYGGRCAYCARKPAHLQQEHVEPLVLGGAHAPENVVPACARCNGSKNSRSLLAWVAQYGMPA
jgi:5-methylcytosine-specific restriction endonuclease McrA